ncbi:MAG: class I SAM-dependent methyltransferase [Nitrospirae bacterium]|nr:class I SAM-dependent methyltransferase [Nitrospirota bacterium]
MDNLKQVEDFWNQNLCGRHFITAKYPSAEFFEQYRRFRYGKEHHLDWLINWRSAAGKDLLEIGLGVGADASRWAAYAMSYTGVDLTTESVEATKRHFEILDLKGSILKGNAEALPFADNSFDLVYSHGVIHHTTDIMKALSEIFRVTRSEGEIVLMLYSKDSFNYWGRIQFYFRLRFLLALLKTSISLRTSEPWTGHISNFRREGPSYFSWNGWYHHCTDGPNCKIANIYHRQEIVDMLEKAGFIVTNMKKAHFPFTGGKYPIVERYLAQFIGFYQFVWAKKR